MRFRDRVAIVTGAAGGIGRAVARALAHEGASVALVDVDAGRLSALQAEMDPKVKVQCLACDVRKGPEVRALVQHVEDRFHRVDVLVNSAGTIRRGTVETVTDEDWEDVLAVNLTGAFHFCKAVVGPMRRQEGGVIVNVSSIAAKAGDITSAPGYASSKAGMDALTKSLARQLAPHSIRVNAVSPHAIETEMSAQWPEAKRREVVAGIPLGHLGKPEDVAEAVLFLASDRASFITGEILDVNGGAWMD